MQPNVQILFLLFLDGLRSKFAREREQERSLVKAYLQGTQGKKQKEEEEKKEKECKEKEMRNHKGSGRKTRQGIGEMLCAPPGYSAFYQALGSLMKPKRERERERGRPRFRCRPILRESSRKTLTAE